MSKLLSNRLVSVFLSAMAAALAVAFFAYATSVGSSVTITDNTTLGDAVSDVITANGYFTQVRVGTGSVFEDIGAVGADELGVEGTAEIDGLVYLDGGFISAASSTISSGVVNIGGSLGIASSTPSTEVGVVGSVLMQENSGTTTLTISSPTSGKGGCIELEATDGTVVRLYATTTPPSSGIVTVRGSVSARGLVVEAGSCLE